MSEYYGQATTKCAFLYASQKAVKEEKHKAMCAPKIALSQHTHSKAGPIKNPISELGYDGKVQTVLVPKKLHPHYYPVMVLEYSIPAPRTACELMDMHLVWPAWTRQDHR